jgi:large subunit ribosomal protein L3
MTLILGRKEGMTQFFAEDGTLVGVTVVAAGPCVVSQVRNAERDGYEAIQLGFENVGDKHLTKPLIGHFKKVGIAPKRFLREERLVQPTQLKAGDTVTVESFTVGQLVDVTGTMKGRGFSGTIRRHNFSRGPAGHGSMNVRAPGSIATKRIGKVAKGKRMAGQFGNTRSTVKNVRIMRIDTGRNLLFLAGSVPGPRGGFVQVCTAKTAPKKGPAK